MNTAKVNDLTKRFLKLSTSSNMTIAEVASAHNNCMASLALEACGGDQAKAAKLLRDSVEDLAERVMDPTLKVSVAVENGKVVRAK